MPATTIHKRTCPLCEAMCGLRVHVTGEQVGRVEPDPDDVWSRGYVCPKGATLGHLHHDADRLRVPMIREGTTWREATWPEAFARAEELLAGVIARHGKEAVTAYIGNPTVHNFSISRYVGLFIGMSGLPTVYSAGTVDQWPKNLTAALMYGGMWAIGVPDLPRTDYLLLLGANPAASQGSLLACPDVLGHLDAIRARGGKVVVVDPRRTGTAEKADQWLPIVPGTDAAFLLAIVHTLFAEERVDLGDVADLVNGLDDVRTAAADFSPEAVSATCDIPAATIRTIARELAEAKTSVVYGRIGTCTQEFGTLASWLVDVVNVLTGNCDRAGGMLFGKPVAWSVASLPHPDFANGFTFHRWKTRVRGAPEVLGQVPVSCLAEEIATPGPGRIRGLVTIAGNPVISGPGAAGLDAALPELECMISVDNWLNETTRHAHVILPGLSALEQPHFDDMIWLWAVRSAGKYSPAILPPPADRPREWEILTRLAAVCMGITGDAIDVGTIDDGYFAALAAMQGIDAAAIGSEYTERGPERLLDLTIRTGPFGDRYGANPGGLTLRHFKEAPDGLDLGPLVPRVRDIIATPSKRIELAPPYVLADLPRLRARLERPRETLVLISRRHLRSNNSWMHNVPVLVSGRERCTLLVHPADAERTGVRHGEKARITSTAGSIEAPVEVNDEMAPGVVSLPHGWGHDRAGVRLGVATAHAGVNNNLLAPPELVDVPSGNAVLNGIPVSIRPA
jgi:anaerobic selenocysteine-containing dehydrogenase